MINDIYFSVFIGLFIFAGSFLTNYYYNFYHIYRYLDSYQKLNYFHNVNLINYLKKNIKIKDFIIYYFLVPFIKFNFITISLFTSILYSLCEKDFKSYLEKKNINLDSNITLDSNTIIPKTNLININNKEISNITPQIDETNIEKRDNELIINHDYLNIMNNKKYKTSMLNEYIELNEEVKLLNDKELHIKNNDFNKSSLLDNSSINYSLNMEQSNQYQMNISNELDLLINNKNESIDKVNDQEENIDSYIVNDVNTKSNSDLKIIKSINELKSEKNSDDNIMETIRIDEIDFGENLESILKSSNVVNIKSNEKSKEIKILPIKIGKKKY